MKYCTHCSSLLIIKIPENDTYERYVCSTCGDINYQNPLIVTGAIIEQQGKILLCKRAIEPRKGYWTIPGGFMELNETTEEGAIRESYEEAMADVKVTRLHGIYNIPRVNQVYFVYAGHLVGDKFGATYESSDVKLFTPENIPWDEMAFGVITVSLQYFIEVGNEKTPLLQQLTIGKRQD